MVFIFFGFARSRPGTPCHPRGQVQHSPAAALSGALPEAAAVVWRQQQGRL